MADYGKYNEEQLVALLSEGSHEAFTEIYRRFWRTLLDSAYKRIYDQSIAEDIVQDVFASLYNQRERLNLTGSLPAYLHSLLKHKVLDEVRKQLVRKKYHEEWKLSDIATAPEAERLIEEKELGTLKDRAVERMPEKCREVYRLKENEQLSNKEIALRLQISEKTVEGHVSRARRILKEQLKDYPLYFILLLISTLLIN